MREILPPNPAALAARCVPIARWVAVLALGLCSTAPAATAEEDHLPEKAKIVSQKFADYQKTATPRAVEQKREEVIAYLGTILKQEAADADLEGALAVKDLIDQLRGVTPRQNIAPSSEAESEAPSQSSTAGNQSEGLKQTPFSLGEKRRLEFPFYVTKSGSPATLRCEFTGASDDTGDRGLNYQLIDPDGKVAKGGFLRSSDGDVVTHKTRAWGRWMVVLIDKDTALEGEYPGNNGTVSVTVTRSDATLASARRPQ